MEVVHVLKEPYDVYIGRKDARIGEETSVLHNPFRSEGISGKPWAIEKFREYLRDSLSENRDVRQAVRRLQGKVAGCWCDDDVCHGQVIKQLSDNQRTSVQLWISYNTFAYYVAERPDGTKKKFMTLDESRRESFDNSTVLFGVVKYKRKTKQYVPLFVTKRNMFGSHWEPHPDYAVDFRR